MFEHLTSSAERPTAVVVAVQLPDVSDGELASSIAELERLAKTLGLVPVGRLIQRRSALASHGAVPRPRGAPLGGAARRDGDRRLA